MNYYSNNFRPQIVDYIKRSSVYELYQNTYLNRTPEQSFDYYPLDDLEKQKQEDIERFKYAFQTLLKDISTNLYKVSDDTTVKDIAEYFIDLYNGHGGENDDISFHFFGTKKKNKRKNYNFYLKSYNIDSMRGIELRIVGYVCYQEFEMSLQISKEHLEMLRN